MAWWFLAGAVCVFGMMLTCCFWWTIISEPFSGIWDYTADALTSAMLLMSFLLPLPVLLALGVGAAASLNPDTEAIVVFNRVSRWGAMIVFPAAALLGAHGASWTLLGAARRNPSDWINGPPTTSEILTVAAVLHAAAVLAGVVIVVGGRLCRGFDALGQEQPGVCGACGYEVAGLRAGICPECGAVVGDADMLDACRSRDS